MMIMFGFGRRVSWRRRAEERPSTPALDSYKSVVITRYKKTEMALYPMTTIVSFSMVVRSEPLRVRSWCKFQVMSLLQPVISN